MLVLERLLAAQNTLKQSSGCHQCLPMFAAPPDLRLMRHATKYSDHLVWTGKH